MWDYSDSEPDDDMVSRCSYCGRFCARAKIHAQTGLCLPCKEKLHPGGTEPEVEVHEAEADKMAVDGKESGGESAGSKAEGNEAAPQESDSLPQGTGESNAPDGPGLCARCWTRPPTRVLYNSPTCDDCFQVAQDAKQRRFQPPTSLQPGKKLTRVCDSCRQKRKRCEHRRVVDADDPAVADRGRKRVRVEAPISEDEEPECPSTNSEANQPTASSSSTIEETATSHCGSSDENMQWAIKQSVETVYRREMERLVKGAEAKMAEATEAFDAVKRHMNMWLYELSKSGGS
ncbi:predicted protein [Uncinocarpus reesii 1704]|uniref:Uncharacterized protein n=1 Tax=Uncinocarpus reesii (strain UAMH 1704) TaxID=336963 RepID=C4JDC0_UNCRE|nr:uncharacterized protein UREG_00680 [Uncinocarpus reesii 1704]EEP75833.1 predicted protein [Uncinocarpus reesii 1704]